MNEEQAEVRIQGGDPITIQIGCPPPDYSEENARKLRAALGGLEGTTFDALARRMSSLDKLEDDVGEWLSKTATVSTSPSRFRNLCESIIYCGKRLQEMNHTKGEDVEECLAACFLALLQMAYFADANPLHGTARAAFSKMKEESPTP